jgi:hypothetical protein
VKVPADTPMPLNLVATARAALQGVRTAVARASTEVDAQPELYIRLVTQPDATVEPNGVDCDRDLRQKYGNSRWPAT